MTHNINIYLFIISFLFIVLSCGIKKNDSFDPIDCGISIQMIRETFIKKKSTNYLNLEFIDSLKQKNNPKIKSEHHVFLSSLSILLNNNLSLDVRLKKIYQQIQSDDFHTHSAYLKFTIHFNMYLIFLKQKKHSLALDEIMIAVSYLEEQKKYLSEKAYSYYLIAYTSSYYLGDIEKSAFAYEKALDLYEQQKDYINIRRILYNLSILKYENKEFILAKKYSEKAIQVFKDHLPTETTLVWTAIYPAYFISLLNLNEKEKIKLIYQEAKYELEQKNISQDIYDRFILASLKSIAKLNMTQEFEAQVNRLEKKLPKTCKYTYSLSQLYSGLCAYQKIIGDKKERETQIKRMENAACRKGMKYYNQEYAAALDRLIQIDKDNNNATALNNWYDKKLGLTVIEDDKNNVYLKQLNYWTAKNLRFAKIEVSSQKKKLRASKIQTLIISSFSGLLLLLLLKIGQLLKEVNSKEKVLKETNNNLEIKNTELNNSYHVQKVQKLEIEEQYVKLEYANQIIKNKNIELVGDLKNQLLLASNNAKVFKRLSTEMDTHIKDSSLKNKLKNMIRTNQNEQIWNNIDQKFLSINENFFRALSFEFPKLTKTDLKLCALIKMNLSTKEIARISYQTPGSTKVSRSRLRKKLSLINTSTNLVTFLNTFSSTPEEHNSETIYTH